MTAALFSTALCEGRHTAVRAPERMFSPMDVHFRPLLRWLGAGGPIAPRRIEQTQRARPPFGPI